MPGVQPESEAAVPLLENGDRLTRDEFEWSTSRHRPEY
jgi:hypothetical protein